MPASSYSDGFLGIVVGLAAEARLARGLGRVAIGGGDAAGAARAARRLLDEGAGGLLSFGLAGGLDPALAAGALVVPRVVACGERRYDADPALSRRCGGFTATLLLGGDAIAVTEADKRTLFRRSGAAAIDLESGAVAEAAEGRVPFAALRAVCDPAARTLPPAALAALDARGAIGLGRVLASLARHPTQLPALLALAQDAAAARRALRQAARRG